jgi:glycosyltransferase involved in cell wall biosynthesis
MNRHFKIVIPFYNVEDWIRRTVLSVKHQNYESFQCIMINDLSTDNTVDLITKEIEGDDRFMLIQNKEKKYPFENIKTALETTSPDKEDVVVILHGDDWLAHGRVLSVLNEKYKKKDCWMTYGSYVEYPSMQRGKFSQKVDDNVIQNNSFRKAEWSTSHLQTFKYALWSHLEDESFKEPENKEHHFMGAWDLAWTYPLLELAGSKSHYIKEVLYIYNRQNPLNVDKVDRSNQLDSEQIIRNMKPMKPLEEL